MPGRMTDANHEVQGLRCREARFLFSDSIYQNISDTYTQLGS